MNFGRLCTVATSEQELLIIDGEHYIGCEILEKERTGLGFRATRSELNMLSTKPKGFFNKLDASFKSLQ